MKPIKIYLLISILINFAMICCGFVFGKFDGEFVNDIQMNVWIDFIGAPNKYLLQAVDSKQNKLSIKTSKTFSDDKTKLIIDFNGLINHVRIYKYRRYPEIFSLRLQFVFKQNNLYYRSRYRSYNKLLLSNIVFNSNNIDKQINSNFDWPNIGDLDKMSNQTKIWLGYSNQMTNNENFDSDWSTNQIIGCVHFINLNNKLIKLEMIGDHFYNYCSVKDSMESICQEGNCKSVIVYNRHILDCKYGLSEMNTAKHCYQNLSNNINNGTDLLQSFERIGDDANSKIVQLAWVTQQSINQCLMEIITRNNTFIEIYSNSFKQIILAIKHNNSINWSIHILYEISSNQIHILRIEFAQSKSIFKVSNGNFIKTLILPQIGPVKLINVGKTFGDIICQQLTKKIVFHYKQSIPNNESKLKCQIASSWDHNWIIFIILIISVSYLTLIFIGSIIYKIKKKKENISRSTLNVCEEPIEMSNWAPPTCAAVIGEKNN